MFQIVEALLPNLHLISTLISLVLLTIHNIQRVPMTEKISKGLNTQF